MKYNKHFQRAQKWRLCEKKVDVLRVMYICLKNMI